jgi:hypothetical protein
MYAKGDENENTFMLSILEILRGMIIHSGIAHNIMLVLFWYFRQPMWRWIHRHQRCFTSVRMSQSCREFISTIWWHFYIRCYLNWLWNTSFRLWDSCFLTLICLLNCYICFIISPFCLYEMYCCSLTHIFLLLCNKNVVKYQLSMGFFYR